MQLRLTSHFASKAGGLRLSGETKEQWLAFPGARYILPHLAGHRKGLENLCGGSYAPEFQAFHTTHYLTRQKPTDVEAEWPLLQPTIARSEAFSRTTKPQASMPFVLSDHSPVSPLVSTVGKLRDDGLTVAPLAALAGSTVSERLLKCSSLTLYSP